MNKEEILKFFEEENAIKHGHFVLSSGKRSSIYCQCAKLFENPDNGRYVCNELKKIILKKINKQIDCVISPALGGILVGYELAKSLNCNFVFYERINNEFELRRGFKLEEYSNVLFVEDVITTGKSTKECLEKINQSNVNLLGIAALVDRSKENIFKDNEIISLLKLDIPIFDPDNLPDDLINIPPEKPGSRKL